MEKYVNIEKFKRELIDKRSFYPSIVKNALENMPVEDMVEIVRCKDCTYRDGEEDLCGNIYCRLHDGRFDKDGYCSYGKREVD